MVESYERRTTQRSVFSGATPRAGAIFIPSFVLRRLWSAATLRVFCLAGTENGLQQDDFRKC